MILKRYFKTLEMHFLLNPGLIDPRLLENEDFKDLILSYHLSMYSDISCGVAVVKHGRNYK